MRVFVGTKSLDLPVHVQHVARQQLGTYHLTLAVRWTDGQRLVAEGLRHCPNVGSVDVAERYPPVAQSVQTESVPPFTLDMDPLDRLPAGPGHSQQLRTPAPPVSVSDAGVGDFQTAPETDISFATIVPPAVAVDVPPRPAQESTAPQVLPGSETRPLPSPSVYARPQSSVAEHYPDRASRATDLLAQAKDAERSGDLKEARRRAALAQAFDPMEPEIQAYLDVLRRKIGN